MTFFIVYDVINFPEDFLGLSEEYVSIFVNW